MSFFEENVKVNNKSARLAKNKGRKYMKVRPLPEAKKEKKPKAPQVIVDPDTSQLPIIENVYFLGKSTLHTMVLSENYIRAKNLYEDCAAYKFCVNKEVSNIFEKHLIENNLPFSKVETFNIDNYIVYGPKNTQEIVNSISTKQ